MQDKGGHIVTVSWRQSLADFSPFPWAYLERIQDPAVVVDDDGVSLLPFQPRGTLQAGMNPV